MFNIKTRENILKLLLELIYHNIWKTNIQSSIRSLAQTLTKIGFRPYFLQKDSHKSHKLNT